MENTRYIVKLYGVISDGDPAMIVMELMDLGNLRDYLRSMRPNLNTTSVITLDTTLL